MQTETQRTPGIQAATPGQPPAGERPKATFRWGFGSASLVILLALVLGQILGVMLVGTAKAASAGKLGVGDAFFLAFLLSALWLLWLVRGAVRRFLLEMHVGVSLVVISIAAVASGVLVPQMDGFEDPETRITRQNYEPQYQRFADAEAYFLYHLTHPYGIGIPADPMPDVEKQLEAFGRRFGREEEHNRRKQMKAAFRGMGKQRAIQEFKQRHEGFLRTFFDVATFLHLNRAYKSYWFATLLGLVCASVVTNLFRTRGQKWLTLKKAGFAVTHIGVAMMLVGGGWSKFHEDRGILQLFLHEPPEHEYLQHFNPQKRAAMPFWVRLERFARLDWKQLEVHFADASFSSRPPSYTLWPERVIDLDYADDGRGGLRPRLRLEVLGVWEHARVRESRLSEARGDQLDRSLGRIAVLDTPDLETLVSAFQRGTPLEELEVQRRSTYLVPDYPGSETYYGPLARVGLDWEYRLRAARPDEAAALGARPDLAALFPSEDLLGVLQLRELGRGDVEPRQHPVRLGQTVETEGGYRIEVVEAIANYRTDPQDGKEIRDPRPLREQAPFNPGIRVLIHPPDGGEPERRLVLERVVAEGSVEQSRYAYPDLLLELDWERWSTPGPPRFLLSWGLGLEPRLVAEDGRVLAVAPGSVLPLPGSASPHTAGRGRELFEHAVVDSEIEFLPRQVGPDGFDQSFYSDDVRGLELKVTRDPGTPEERVEVIRMATSTHRQRNVADQWVSPDRSFSLHFFENDRAFPFEWRSVLSIYEADPEGRWHVYSGADGRLLRTLDAELSREFSERYGSRPGRFRGPSGDEDGDGVQDFVAPLRRVHAGTERQREIRVNDYFTYRGYRFFQTNANPAVPTYSGIGVVYDPGIPTVLTGMYLIIAGTVLAFIVKPIAEGRRRRRTVA
jgi:hypothetical protein